MNPSVPLVLSAPAKLNLFLHVVGRRPDGYHLLESVFELIDLADTVELHPRQDGALTLAAPTPGVDPEGDLGLRAARLLAAEARAAGRTVPGATLRIEKRIPMGAGLGGGSSDAATVLRGLNRLWNLGWATERLAQLGLVLGADVPFFVGGRTAFVTGVGEILRPIELPIHHHVVLTPAVEIPTAVVFRDPELTRDSIPLKIDSLSQVQAVYDAIAEGKNDLQAVVVRRSAPVAQALSLLAEAAGSVGIAPESARMSGSGASVFLPVDGHETALRVVHHLEGRIKSPLTAAGSPEIDTDRLAGRLWIARSMREHLI